MTKKIECYKIKTGEDTGGNIIYTLRCFCNTTACMQQNKKIAHTQNDDSYDDIIKELDKKLYGNIL